MKREILCSSCAEKTSKTITGARFIDGQIVDPYPGEHKKFYSGILTRSCICDSCGNKFSPGDRAIGLSIWADYGGISYYPWEAEFFEKESSI